MNTYKWQCIRCTNWFFKNTPQKKFRGKGPRCPTCDEKIRRHSNSKEESYVPPKKDHEGQEFLRKLEEIDLDEIDSSDDPREVDEEPEPDPLTERPTKNEKQMEMPKIDDDFYREEYEDLVERMAIAKKRYPVEKVWLAVEYEDKLGRMKDIEGVLFFMKWPMLQIETQTDGKWGKTTYVDMRRMEILYRDYKTVDELGYPRKTWKKKFEEPS